MDVLISVALFFFGAIIASFIGVVVGRMHTGQSFLTGRSRCDACDAPLSLLSLVPIFSFLFSRGRARCCGVRISSFAPITEILLGGLFVAAYVVLGISIVLSGMLVSLALILALVLYDLDHQILPSTLLYPFVVTSAATGFFAAASVEQFLSETVLTAVLIALSLAVIHFFSRGRAMGFADAPFAFGLALLVGPAAVAGFIFSFWIGAVIGIVLLLRRPPGSRIGVEVPFAPFLAAGFLLAFFTQWDPFTLVATLLTPFLA